MRSARAMSWATRQKSCAGDSATAPLVFLARYRWAKTVYALGERGFGNDRDRVSLITLIIVPFGEEANLAADSRVPLESRANRSAECHSQRTHERVALMKSYREELWFETKTRRAYLNITPQVEVVLKASGVKEGLVLVNAMHITASVYINDDEPGLLRDYDDFLERLAPHEAVYRHNETGEDNGDAHVKRQLMGREVVVAVTDGRLDFGPWEQIFYGEFDGRRRKRVLVKVIGD